MFVKRNFISKFITFYVFINFISIIHSSNDLNNENTSTIQRQRQTSVKEVSNWMQRAITTSQVLTFNITNALILLVMKAIIIGAGILGKISFWKYPNLGGVPVFRAYHSSPLSDSITNQIYYSIFSNEDKRWTSAYIWALNKNDFGCLYRLACESKQSAQIYLYSGKFFNKWTKSIFRALNGEYNSRYYEKLLQEIQNALNLRLKDCKSVYKCKAPFETTPLDTFNIITKMKVL